MRWFREWLSNDYHFVYSERDIKNELTTLAATFIISSAVMFLFGYDTAFITGIVIYVFFRYMQRGYDEGNRF